MEGRRGLFVVGRVDAERAVADLIEMAGAHTAELEVPFQAIRFLDEDVSTIIREFLNS